MGENSLGGREPKDEEGSELRERKKKNQKNGGRMRKERKEIGKGRERGGEEEGFLYFHVVLIICSDQGAFMV